MYWIALLEHNPNFLYGIVALFSLAVGSFLNVIIHRLPEMLDYDWHQEYAALTGRKVVVRQGPRPSLVYPPSQGRHCGHWVWALENIPLLGYLVLRGRCSSCGGAISLRAPLVEVGTTLLSVLVVRCFGIGWESTAPLFSGPLWLLAMFGARLGWQYLPQIILFSVCDGGPWWARRLEARSSWQSWSGSASCGETRSIAPISKWEGLV